MSAGALAAVTPRSDPFILRIGGRVLTSVAPLPFPGDDGAVTSCTISETAEGSPNQMTFVLEDPTGNLEFDFSEITEMIDRRSGSERILFGGHLVEITSRPRGSNQGRILTCTALGYDVWLDWRMVISWSSKTDVNGRVTRITSERAMVQQLVNAQANFIATPDSLITNQTTNMEVVSVKKMTLREALERIGETATYADDDSTRNFYVDNAMRLHWYRGSENLVAPYRVGDGSYTRTVMDTSGLVSLWPLREASGTTFYDATAYAHATLAGSATPNQTGGIVNEPALRSLRLDGSTGYLDPTGSNLHPGDTFSIEFWCRRQTTGSQQTIWSGGSGDVMVGFDANDKLRVQKEGTGDHFISDTAYTSTSDWYHVVVARSPGATSVYVNGDAISGTTTARTFVAAAGTVNIGRKRSTTDQYFAGRLQHVAVYSTKLSAATALAHYNQGITLTPDDWEYTRSAFEGRERVYVSGANTAGTGWVEFPSLRQTAFGIPGRQPAREEIIDRDDSEGNAKRRAYGRWFLRANKDPMRYGSFSITGYDGWRVGQRVFLTATADGLSAYEAEIKSVDTDVLFGSGVLKYTIGWGRAKWSGARAIARRNNRGR
jgi:hypothetical protein